MSPAPRHTLATAATDAQTKTPDATAESAEYHPTSLAMAHFKQPSTSSLPDVSSFSPDSNGSRIPRPTSTTGKKQRHLEGMSIKEALGRATADQYRRIDGSPSPAPRFSRMSSASSDIKPLHGMFSQKPLDLGRLPARRGSTLSSRGSFGSASHKGDDSNDEIDRTRRQVQQDEKILKAMKEETKGPFIRRRAASNGIGSTTPVSARKARGAAAHPGAASFGNDGLGASNHDEPRSTWGDKAKYDPNWLRQFQNHPDAALAFHERVSGPSKTSSDLGSMAMPARPATTGPALQKEPFQWQVDDEFTARDLQVSTSPPVSFGVGRPSKKIDELKRLEIDVERQHPIPSDLFAKRSNTRLDEIARLEREAARTYPVPNVEDSGPVAMVDAQPPPPPQAHSSFSPPRVPPLPTNESSRAAKSLPSAGLATKLPEPATERRSPSPDIRRKSSPEPPQQPTPPPDGINSSDGHKIPNIPVTVFSGTGPSKYKSTRQQPTLTHGVVSEPLEKEPAKDDAQDLLRRLSRASSRSPSTSPVHNKADNRTRGDEREAPVPVVSDKADPIAKGIRTKSANKTGSPSKPRVGFIGISRSSSTNSLSSNQSSVASHDPTARLEAEADLFALDNQSERGSFRVPSPLSDSESEAEDQKADEETPRPDRFGPAPMPTPQVTGAYVDTPVTVKVDRRDVSEDTDIPQPNLPLPKKDPIENRATSTSPKASKSDSQARYPRRRQALREARRAKSEPRHRSPLKNSSKLPTAKSDLRQICRKNEIDDSTLDDLADLADLAMSFSNAGEPKGEDERLDRVVVDLRTSRKGLEDIERRIAHSGMQEKPEAKKPSIQHRHSHPLNHDSTCPECVASPHTDMVTYMHVPVPRLYRTKPKFKLTFTGILLLLFCLWHMYWFAEDLFYDRWGKQAFCYRGSPCRWDVDDPEYGYVIPVKLDEWLTGGVVRPHASRWLEEAQDTWADFEDWCRGIDIQQVDHRVIRDSAKKAQYWRRIEKKGLFPKWNPAAWMLPQIEAWERETAAREEAEARAAMGYDVFEEVGVDSMAKDQPVQSDSTDESISSWW